MKQYLILSIIFSIVIMGTTTLSIAQPDIPTEPGKCYVQCYSNFYADKNIIKHSVFTGEQGSSEFVKTITITTPNEGCIWRRAIKNEDCLSKQQKDCITWCLIKTQGDAHSIEIVTDTIQESQFEIQTFAIGAFQEWQEVVCETDKSLKLIKKLIEALTDLEYYDNEDMVDMDDMITYKNKISPTLRLALMDFQFDNNLPVGNLNIKTLELLEISY